MPGARVVGLDVTHKSTMSAAQLEALRPTGRFGEYVWRIAQFYKAFHQRTARRPCRRCACAA